MINYKFLFRTEESRFKFLRLLDFVPDKMMIKLQYRIKCGRKLNLNNPSRYTEKIQWYKLYYRTKKMTMCADKYLVREYVKSKGLEDILNPLFGVWENPKDIVFEDLPNEYVLKVTNGSGTNYFVKNNLEEDCNKIRKQLSVWMNRSKISPGREWAYHEVEPRIIAEKMLPRNSENDIPDYKFFCFNGEPRFLYTMIDYIDCHENGKLGFFDMDFNPMPFKRVDFDAINTKIEKPACFEKMVEYARILSNDFPHVRVDFYNIEGEIVFGELTFYNASGYTAFEPDEYDYLIGDMFELPNKTMES